MRYFRALVQGNPRAPLLILWISNLNISLLCMHRWSLTEFMVYIKFNNLVEGMIVCKMLLLLIAFVFIKTFRKWTTISSPACLAFEMFCDLWPVHLSARSGQRGFTDLGIGMTWHSYTWMHKWELNHFSFQISVSYFNIGYL